MPDMKVGDPGSLATLAGNTTAIDRNATTARANRSSDRTSTTAVTSPTLDVWRLPMMTYSIASVPWGERADMLGRGLDLMAPVGTALYAAHGGTVSLARWYGGYGYTVIIDVGNGVQLVYAHASALTVQEGQQVSSGQLVALSGNSGYSFAPHVHFEVQVNGHATDAATYLLDHGVDVAKHSDVWTG